MHNWSTVRYKYTLLIHDLLCIYIINTRSLVDTRSVMYIHYWYPVRYTYTLLIHGPLYVYIIDTRSLCIYIIDTRSVVDIQSIIRILYWHTVRYTNYDPYVFVCLRFDFHECQFFTFVWTFSFLLLNQTTFLFFLFFTPSGLLLPSLTERIYI